MHDASASHTTPVSDAAIRRLWRATAPQSRQSSQDVDCLELDPSICLASWSGLILRNVIAAAPAWQRAAPRVLANRVICIREPRKPALYEADLNTSKHSIHLDGSRRGSRRGARVVSTGLPL
ncbi:hypothetical protein G7046_g7362 [Stylonectria norvegica]|nr:hypothetical protein G7046_g7362 [Stylonectria norvegica]